MPVATTTESAKRHQVVARLARRQGGAVARWQLHRLGLNDNVIASHLSAHRWQRAHIGVFYTFTGLPDVCARRWAALLFCGPGAVLSHETAAEIHRYERRPTLMIHVTIANERKERVPSGIRIHRSRLMPRKAVRHNGYPVTSAADTVLDLIGQTRRFETVVEWITRACRTGGTDVTEILAAMAKRKRQRHRDFVKAVCLDVADGTHSNLEHAYRNRVEKAHGLPRGRRQAEGVVRDGVIYRDVEYEEYLLVVELDGRLGHEGVGQHRDAARDNDTTEFGKRSLRYGHAPVMGDPCEVARQVAAVLRQQGWTGELRPCGPNCTATR